MQPESRRIRARHLNDQNWVQFNPRTTTRQIKPRKIITPKQLWHHMPPITNQPARPGRIVCHQPTSIEEKSRFSVSSVNLHAEPASVVLVVAEFEAGGEGGAVELEDPVAFCGVQPAFDAGGLGGGEDGVVEAGAGVVGLDYFFDQRLLRRCGGFAYGKGCLWLHHQRPAWS